MSSIRFIIVGLGLLGLMTIGCDPGTPEVVQAKGNVTINGEPLPNALVSFIPMAEGLDGNHKCIGTTDENGNFTLASYAGMPGAYACINKVTIVDGEAPEEARSMDAEGADRWNEYKASLKNRPIPKEYMSIGQTPVAIEVKVGQTEYNIELER